VFGGIILMGREAPPVLEGRSVGYDKRDLTNHLHGICRKKEYNHSTCKQGPSLTSPLGAEGCEEEDAWRQLIGNAVGRSSQDSQLPKG